MKQFLKERLHFISLFFLLACSYTAQIVGPSPWLALAMVAGTALFFGWAIWVSPSDRGYSFRIRQSRGLKK
jgi:hypothetical protein